MFDDTKPTVPYEDATQTGLYSRKLMRTLMTVAADAISGSRLTSWQLILLMETAHPRQQRDYQFLKIRHRTEDTQHWYIVQSNMTFSTILIYAFPQNPLPRSESDDTLQLLVRLALEVIPSHPSLNLDLFGNDPLDRFAREVQNHKPFAALLAEPQVRKHLVAVWTHGVEIAVDKAVGVCLSIRQPALPELPCAQLLFVVGRLLFFCVDVGVVVVHSHPRLHGGLAEASVGTGIPLHWTSGVVARLLFQHSALFRQLLGIVPVEFLAFLPEVDGFNVLVFFHNIPGLRHLL